MLGVGSQVHLLAVPLRLLPHLRMWWWVCYIGTGRTQPYVRCVRILFWSHSICDTDNGLVRRQCISRQNRAVPMFCVPTVSREL